MKLAAGAILAGTLAGCGHVEGEAANSNSTAIVTLGSPADEPASNAEPTNVQPASASQPSAAEAVSANDQPAVSQSPTPTDSPNASSSTTSTPADESRSFKVEGPDQAIRVSFDDVDLLKVLNLDPVPADAPERLPKWLKALDGKRIRVRGFMFPPFQDTDIRGFVLARDNQICCFGRTPKEYDLIDTFMRKGVTTHYIQGRPFDVVGVFHIKTNIEKYTAMYELEDAIVIEK
jgi:hypothetical protein